MGIQNGLKRAQRVWWPGITKDVKEYVKRCHTCQSQSDKQQREPMESFEIPMAPGLVIGSDFFECGRDEYVIFVDLFSTWIEFFKVQTKDAKNLIKALRLYMTRNGVPRVFTSDQGSAFTSVEFEDFCKKYGIRRADGTAKHERGNAHAEAAVKKVKKMLMRCHDEDELARAIIAWHQTSLAPGRPSPAQIHLGRNVRDELHWNVQQAQVQWEDVRQWRQERNDRAKEYFDRGTRKLTDLTEGQEVFVQTDDGWKEGQILKKLERPRSYAVRMENGRVWERNRVKLKPNATTHSEKPKRPVTMFNPCDLQRPLPAREPEQPAVAWWRADAGPVEQSGSPEHDSSAHGAPGARMAAAGDPVDDQRVAEERDDDVRMDIDDEPRITEGSPTQEESTKRRREVKKRRRLIEEMD